MTLRFAYQIIKLYKFTNKPLFRWVGEVHCWRKGNNF